MITCSICHAFFGSCRIQWSCDIHFICCSFYCSFPPIILAAHFSPFSFDHLWPQMDRLRRSLTLRVVDLKAARQLRRHLQGGGRHKVLQRVATATCHVAMTCTMLNLYELVALLLTPKAMSSLSNMNIPLVCMYMSSNCPRQ